MTGRARTGESGVASPWRIAVWGGAAALLAVPAVATQVSDEMQWDAADFILAGAVLLAGCGLWELAMRRSGNWAYSAGAGLAIAAALLLLLVNGAVGFIGSEADPVNSIFLGVIAVGLVGAAVARLRSRGMALAMAVTAGAQVAAGIAGAMLVPDIRGLIVGTALFTPLWLLSAWLFRKAAPL
jgi:uncharacterized membrane protein YoaK (UPF0700 family)